MKYLYDFLKMCGGSAQAIYLLAAFFSNQSIFRHCIISERQRELTKDRVKLSVWNGGGSSQVPSSRHWASDCFPYPLSRHQGREGTAWEQCRTVTKLRTSILDNVNKYRLD